MAVCSTCGFDNALGAADCARCGAVLSAAQELIREPVGRAAETSETMYYQQGRTTISNARAVFGGNTYAMANITSVGVGQKGANMSGPFLLVALSGCSAVVANYARGTALALWGLAAVFLILAGAAFMSGREEYYVRIVTSAGEVNALQSPNKVEVEKIVLALNEAIVKRG